MEDRRKWIALIGFALVTDGAGALGALTTTSNLASWYGRLNKPAGTPPPWLFGPVWTMFYVLIAISAWMVYVRRSRDGRARAMALFWVQLVLDAAWTPIFFGMRQLGPALAVILLLDLAVTTWITATARVSRTAAALLTPYLVWILYATCLNYGIWSLNAG